jgi:uracil-DNA glycosylase family 4
MPLIPNDDPEALAELLGYLGEIGYGELYLRRAPGTAGGATPATAGALGVVTAPGRERSGGAVPEAASVVGELVAAARQAGGGGTAPELPGSPAAGDVDAEARAALMGAMAEAVAACRRCRLCEGRQKTVFGAGNPNADLMFIGEGPGAEEDRQGLPFVGRAGELLTRIIEAIGMTRDQVYIANIVKCRPPGNRDPQPDEVAACRSYLERQIALVRPRLLVALGRIAAQTLLGNDLPIGRMRGQWFEVLGVPLMVTYHPAALLRNPALKRPTWEDMQQVRDRLLREA